MEINMTKDDDLITTRESADILGVSKDSIRSWVHSGKLPAVRVGRSFRFRRSDVLLLITKA